MSSPEIQRRVRQQGADIDSLYELVQGVDEKVVAVDHKVDALGAQVEAGFAAAEQRDAELRATLDQILQRLGGTS